MRDVNLVRDILLSVEAGHAGVESEIADQDIINHHLHLMIDGGLLNGKEVNEGQWRILGLTWEGYELLELIRENWAAIGDKLNEAQCYNFELMREIARGLIE